MADESGKSDEGDLLGHIYWRDEILQVMYWMAGEGFGRDFGIGDLRKFLDADDTLLAKNLEQMVSDRLLERAGEDRYALSALGEQEGGRRFRDEFDGMMKPGHFECDEPDCDCHDSESVGQACKNLSPDHPSHQHH